MLPVADDDKEDKHESLRTTPLYTPAGHKGILVVKWSLSRKYKKGEKNILKPAFCWVLLWFGNMASRSTYIIISVITTRIHIKKKNIYIRSCEKVMQTRRIKCVTMEQFAPQKDLICHCMSSALPCVSVISDPHFTSTNANARRTMFPMAVIYRAN